MKERPRITLWFVVSVVVVGAATAVYAFIVLQERFRALHDYWRDLRQGDPVALALTGVFLLLAGCVVGVWVIDRRWRRQERERAKKAKPRHDIHLPKGSNLD